MTGNPRVTSSKSNSRYLDVDDILVTQERVMCNFEVPVLNMGMLQLLRSVVHISCIGFSGDRDCEKLG